MITANVAWLLLFWIEGLKSGLFTQGIREMQSEFGHCCLGVGECIMNPEPDEVKLEGDRYGGQVFIRGTRPKANSVTELLDMKFYMRTQR